MATVNELAVAGMLKAVTTGAVVSPVGAGVLDALPGNVPALISTRLENVSPSESCDSTLWKLCPALEKALPYEFLEPPDTP
jgi:hypothetical protein